LAQVPQVNHVFIVVEENESFSQIIGNPAMPYLNSLANRFGLATNYFANTHPSIGNYFMLTTGQILTNNDSETPSSFPVSVDNVVREVLAAGKTWKDYAESLPSVGYLGGNTGQYAVRHNPIPYFTDVQNSPQQQQNVCPLKIPM
jgi:acid phosphatase